MKRKKTKTKSKNLLTWLKTASRVNILAALAVTLVVGAVGYMIVSTQARNNQAPERVAGELLLRFRANVPASEQKKVLNRYNLKTIKEFKQIKVKHIRVPEQAHDAVKQALSRNPRVEFVEDNFVEEVQDTVPNDPEWSAQPGLNKIDLPKAWDVSKGSDDVVVAVIDTGIDFKHPDLSKQALSTGWNFVNNTNDPTDDHYHGTYVSGFAAATTHNGTGIASPCWNCKIMPLKTFDKDGRGSAARSLNAILYAADNGAHVINMSYKSGNSKSYENATKYARDKGIVLVSSAGNDSNTTPTYPANYSTVISVASVNSSDSISSFSNYGSWVDVAAQGEGNRTTRPGGSYRTPGGGTSYSSPVVAGLAALLRSAHPDASVAQIEEAIRYNTDSISGSKNIKYGRVNAHKAIQALGGSTSEPTTPPADTTAPTVSISSPINGSTVSGQIAIEVAASDNVGVTKVEIYRNGQLMATDTTEPYSFFWDTTKHSNGSYSFSAKAYDAAGNTKTSSSVSLTVNNPTQDDNTAPGVTIHNPRDGQNVSKHVNIDATATDNVGVTSMEIYLNGDLIAYSDGSSVSTRWNTNPKHVANGSHTIEVRAYDAAGNVGKQSITVVK